MRKILIFGSIYLDHPASSIEKTREGCILVLLLAYKQGVEDHEPAGGLLRGYYGKCLLKS
jgi:hypothetical protein